MEEKLPAPQAVQKNRPIGVWVLTIYALIVAGILPLFLEIYLLVSGEAAGNEFVTFLSILISIGVITSAIGAWKGNDTARKSLLVFVTLHYVLVAISNTLLINSGQVPEGDQIRTWGRVLRGFLYSGVYIWYFTRDTTKEFYN